MWRNFKYVDLLIIILGVIFAIVPFCVALLTSFYLWKTKGNVDLATIVGVNLALIGVLSIFFNVIFVILRNVLKSIDERTLLSKLAEKSYFGQAKFLFLRDPIFQSKTR